MPLTAVVSESALVPPVAQVEGLFESLETGGNHMEHKNARSQHTFPLNSGVSSRTKT